MAATTKRSSLFSPHAALLEGIELYRPEALPTEMGCSILIRTARSMGFRHANELLESIRKTISNGRRLEVSFYLIAEVALKLTGLSPDAFAVRHSVLPCTAAFRLRTRAKNGGQAPSSNVTSTGFGHQIISPACWRPLKLPQICVECVREDRAWHRFSYWRAHHHVPGVCKCIKHGCLLTPVACDPFENLPSDFEDAYLADLPTLKSIDGMAYATSFQKVSLGLLDLKVPIDALVFGRLIGFLATCNGYTTKRLVQHPAFTEDRNQSAWLASVMCGADYPNLSGVSHQFLRLDNCIGGNIFAAACVAAVLLTVSADAALGLFKLAGGALTKDNFTRLGQCEATLAVAAKRNN